MAEVTARHRKLAAIAVCDLTDGDLARCKNQVMAWIESGQLDSKAGAFGDLIHLEMGRVAQAIADAEERGTPGAQREAWEQGCRAAAGFIHDEVHIEIAKAKNPYPAPDKTDG